MSHTPIVIEPPAKKKSPLDEWNKQLHPDLPAAPFSILVVGGRNTGKSVLVRSLLNHEADGMYGKAFLHDNKIFISPTLDRDSTFDDVKFGHKFNPMQISLSGLATDLVEQQQENVKNNVALPVLLVFDDITQVAGAWEILLMLGYVGRHSNLHTIAIAHKLSSIPRGVRTQSQQWIFFKPKERSEWDWILELFAQKKSKLIWEHALTRAWDIPYNFVFINFEKKEPHDIYRSGFHNPLFSPEEWNNIITNNGTMEIYDNRASTEIDKSADAKDAAKLQKLLPMPSPMTPTASTQDRSINLPASRETAMSSSSVGPETAVEKRKAELKARKELATALETKMRPGKAKVLPKPKMPKKK
jgi:hypothetical protein